jgi:phosphoribosylformylglycinamidine synthase PurS subunit
MKVVVNVYLKEGVLDPQGKAVHHALGSLGFNGVNDVRVGKQIVMDVDSSVTKDEIKNMCETLLANTVIEDYNFEILS